MTNLFHRFRKPNPTKIRDDQNVIGFALHADGRVDAIKQGSGMYGAGLGEGAYSETAFGTAVALSQSTFGWSAAYSVSTWVYRCIEVRKSAVHRMPHGVYSKRTKQILPKHPLNIALLRNKQKLLKKIEQSQLLYGETFLELPQNDYGFRSDLFWLNNNGMAVLIGAGYIVGYSYTAMQGGQPQNFNVDELAFMKTDNPFNDLRGMSPTEVIMDEVAIDKDVARVVRAYYANNTRVGLLLIPKQNMLESDVQRFMDVWNMQNKGVNKAGKPNLMPYDMTVERIQEPATLDDVQLRESTRREIAAAYGVPLSLAGGWDDAKYQSLPEQRKSFYEETVIPECDNIAEFINSDVLPYFDDSGNTEFKFDYMQILALTEDAQKKNDIYSNRLVSGLITRAEARQALGHPVRESDDVYYIPMGATIVPADQEALVTPTANVVSNEQPGLPDAPQTPLNPLAPQLPAPKTPTAQIPANTPAPKPSTATPEQPPRNVPPPQKSALDELNAWEKKALNTNAIKASFFVCYVVSKEVQETVRDALQSAGKDANKTAIRAVFAVARKALDATKYSDDQPRDDHGRWSGGGGSGASGSTKPVSDHAVVADEKGGKEYFKKNTKIYEAHLGDKNGSRFEAELKGKSGFSVEQFVTMAGGDVLPTDKFDTLQAKVMPVYQKSATLFGPRGNIQEVSVVIRDPHNIDGAPDIERTFHFDENGKPDFIKNEHFYLPKDQTGSGLGTRLFSAQVENAAGNGFKRIDTVGGKSSYMNGYYTWARVGYEAEVNGPSGKTRLTDLMQTSQGRDYWKKNGVQTDMSFDLTPNSRSRKILDAYKASRIGA